MNLFIYLLLFNLIQFISCLKLNNNKIISLHLIILGPPCSGKGTQCNIIKNKYNLIHLSSGDILRSIINKQKNTLEKNTLDIQNTIEIEKNIKQNNQKEKNNIEKNKKNIEKKIKKNENQIKMNKLNKFEEYLKVGKLIPDSDITKLIIKRLNEKDCKKNGWILDGFPRTFNQAKLFMKSKNNYIDGIILLNVTDEMILSRGLGRCIDPVTGKIYHKINNPPPSNILHRIQTRDDDTKITLQQRIEDYKKQIQDISKFYKDKIHSVDAMRSPEEVNVDIEKIIDNIKR